MPALIRQKHGGERAGPIQPDIGKIGLVAPCVESGDKLPHKGVIGKRGEGMEGIPPPFLVGPISSPCHVGIDPILGFDVGIHAKFSSNGNRRQCGARKGLPVHGGWILAVVQAETELVVKGGENRCRLVGHNVQPPPLRLSTGRWNEPGTGDGCRRAKQGLIEHPSRYGFLHGCVLLFKASTSFRTFLPRSTLPRFSSSRTARSNLRSLARCSINSRCSSGPNPPSSTMSTRTSSKFAVYRSFVVIRSPPVARVW